MIIIVFVFKNEQIVKLIIIKKRLLYNTKHSAYIHTLKCFFLFCFKLIEGALFQNVYHDTNEC